MLRSFNTNAELEAFLFMPSQHIDAANQFSRYFGYNGMFVLSFAIILSTDAIFASQEIVANQ